MTIRVQEMVNPSPYSYYIIVSNNGVKVKDKSITEGH